MLQDQAAYLLQRYLGNYVRGFIKEALKISVRKGDVELTNMQLKPEALNALKLPVQDSLVLRSSRFVLRK